MSLMAASSCCCGVECTCPVETDLPSSVLVTITATGCEGTVAVLTCVAQLNASAPCEIGVCLCPKYSFTARTETPNCEGAVICNMQAETFDYCGSGSGTGMGEAFIGVSSLGIGTNGTGFNADPYTLCDLWTIRINFSVWLAQPVATIQTASEQNCQECYVSQYYPESPCFRLNVSSIDEVQYCKASGQSPTGTYENCVGLPHEFCGIDPLSCDDCPNTPPFIGITITDITVA